MILFFIPPDSSPDKISTTIQKIFGSKPNLENRKPVPSGWTCLVWKNDTILSRDQLIVLRQEFFSEKIDLIQISQYIEGDSLFCFDMDSTLIQEEVIDELARFAGVYEQVASVTKEAMEGNLNFHDALRKRCVYLKGLPVTVFDELYPKLHPNTGVPELLSGLRTKKTNIAVFSGGFTDILEKFKVDYNLQEIRANYLDREDGNLTGTVSGQIVDKDIKKNSLLELESSFKISKSNLVAVGDGANDQLMLESAGIGIGFHAKEGLKSKIENWVDFASMDVLLYLFKD